MRTVPGACLLMIGASGAFGQTAAAPPAFEVASVKVSKLGVIDGAKMRDAVESSPGRLTIRNGTLIACLQWAYDVKDYQVSGPGWLSSERYDIVAKAADSAPDAQMKLMLQTLLADRFKLTLHREKKEVPVYAMVQGKNPPRLRPSESGGEGGLKYAGSTVTFSRMSMARLANLLARQMDRPVVDMTGLSGLYDLVIDVSESKDGKPAAVKAKMMLSSGMLSVIQDQVGLKVEGRKLPADVLVVDSAEKVPTEN